MAFNKLKYRQRIRYEQINLEVTRKEHKYEEAQRQVELVCKIMKESRKLHYEALDREKVNNG